MKKFLELMSFMILNLIFSSWLFSKSYGSISSLLGQFALDYQIHRSKTLILLYFAKKITHTKFLTATLSRKALQLDKSHFLYFKIVLTFLRNWFNIHINFYKQTIICDVIEFLKNTTESNLCRLGLFILFYVIFGLKRESHRKKSNKYS